jgi:Asp-tRNA(Asn)/Glu-tRNA(Gln) amidotransferase B subunit
MRLGYFIADVKDSKPGRPVFNRTIGLKDTWAKPVAAPTREERKAEKKPKEEKAAAPKKGRAELRGEQRAAMPELAQRYERYQQSLKLSADDADLLTADLETAKYFDAAVAVNANAKSVSKWLLNELLGLAKDRALPSLPLDAAGFGKFVALVDGGKVSQSGAKTLLAHLVEKGGAPEQLLAQLGLEKVEDSGAIDAAVARVLAAQASEVERYRAGEKKLFGVLMGAVMRETQGAADAAAVKKALTAKLG